MNGLTLAGPAEWVLGVSAFVAAVVTIVQVMNRWVVQPLARQLRETVREEVQPLRADLDAVHAQLLADGGMTLRDAINRIESRQDRMEGEIETVLRIVGRPSTEEQ